MFRALKKVQNEEYKKRMTKMTKITKKKIRQSSSASRETFFKNSNKSSIFDQSEMRIKIYSNLKRL